MFEFRSAELATASRVVLMNRQGPAPREVIRRPARAADMALRIRQENPAAAPRDALPKLA